jgi:PAS domain S-box-containing protein
VDRGAEGDGVVTSSKIPILLVDDRTEVSSILTEVLAAPDREIVTASSGPEALRHLLSHEFAVIVLDVIMPGMDGFELASLIRQRTRSAQTPIVFLTGAGSDVSSIYRAYAIGAVDYLTKPVDVGILRAKVSVFVELFEKDRRLRRQADALVESERRNRELELERIKLLSARRYRNLGDAIVQIVWTTDGEGRCNYFNRRWTEYVGEESGITSWMDAVHPEERAACETEWAAAVEHGQPFEGEHRLRGADGSYRWHLCRALPEHDVDGEIVGWLGTHTDLDDLVRARASAEAARQRSDFLASASAVLSASLDHTENLHALSKHAVMALADICVIQIHRSEDLEDALVAAHRTPTLDTSGLASCFLRASRSGELIGDVTAAWEGPELDAARALGLRSAMIAPVGARGMLLLARCDPRSYDLDDLATALELGRRAGAAIDNAILYRRTERAIRTRDEFLSVASHELRTPLSALLLQLGGLERAASDPHPEVTFGPEGRAAKKIAASIRQTRRLTKLVDNLLDVSRLSNRRLALDLEDCDLCAIIQDVAERFEEQAAQSGSEIVVRAPGSVVATCDRSRIDQVVTNLVSNALKYGEGKPVELRVEDGPRGASVSICDGGIGISDADQSRIFERFERAVSITNYGGLGLGLYIARQIVDAHGGSIRVSSKPGNGSTFTVELPRPTASLEDGQSPRS